jgi:hypothetical protein
MMQVSLAAAVPPASGRIGSFGITCDLGEGGPLPVTAACGRSVGASAMARRGVDRAR